ncbi:hypothetical protein JHK85_005808 [Glycine max]|uniref:Uncharacterized protein n=1 Tax=Glycine max TaxID=3847 RepID=C6T528_SOYBN|nr:unknown [Glycine max]KAG5064625.1 hypothetical protein JHK85_005808 [Glycine max]
MKLTVTTKLATISLLLIYACFSAKFFYAAGATSMTPLSSSSSSPSFEMQNLWPNSCVAAQPLLKGTPYSSLQIKTTIVTHTDIYDRMNYTI